MAAVVGDVLGDAHFGGWLVGFVVVFGDGDGLVWVGMG